MQVLQFFRPAIWDHPTTNTDERALP